MPACHRNRIRHVERLRSRGRRPMTIVAAVALLAASLSIALVGAAGRANAVPAGSEFPSTWTIAGNVATGTTPSGVVVTATLTGPATFAGSGSLVLTGSKPAYFPATTTQALQIEETSCTSTAASGCGSITYSFSRPVTTPVLYTGDVGAGGGGATWTSYRDTPVTLTSGGTFGLDAAGSQTSTMSVQNGGTTVGITNAAGFIGTPTGSGSCATTAFGCGVYDITTPTQVVSSITFGLGYAGSGTPTDDFTQILGVTPVAPTPFVCTTPTVFDANQNPTILDAQFQNAGGSTFTPIGTAATLAYNAIAYRPADNLIYGATNGTAGTIPIGHLVIVDSTGAVFDQGAITGLNSADLGLNAGAFDGSGTYWVADSNTAGTRTLYSVNLTTRVATPLAATAGLVTSPDLTWANGFLWGIGQNSTTMLRIDVTTGAVTSFSLAGLVPAGNYGAAWTYGNGNLGFDVNTGGLYQLKVTNPASATPTFTLVSTAGGPASSNNDGTACVPGPVDLGITKTGPATIAPSGTVTWSLTVHNFGPNVSSGYVVSDAIPAGYTDVATSTPGCAVSGRTVTCTEGVLAVGADTTITVTGTAPATTGCLTNTATVTGNEADPVAGNNTSSAQTCVVQPSLSMVKSASPSDSGHFTVGQVITYSFVITNTGGVTLTDVHPTEGAFSGSGAMSAPVCPAAAASVAPGGSVTCTATYTLTQADVDNGSVTNTATATGTPPSGFPTPVTPPSTVTIPGNQTPAIALAKSVNPATIHHAGDPVTYSFLLRNTGNVTLTNVTVDETAFSGTGTAPVVTCPAGAASLAPGAAVTCTATYTATQADVDAGTITNTATATGTPPGALTPPVSPPSSATVTVPPAPAVTVVKSASPSDSGHFTVGQVIIYSFLVTNTGNVTLTPVTVHEGAFSGSGTVSPVSCPAGANSLAPGASVTCTATYTITQADVDAGSVTNAATATGTPPSGPPVDSPPSSVSIPGNPRPGIAVAKSANVTRITAAGQVVTYSFVVTNTGNVTLAPVTVNEGAFSGTGTLSPVTCPAGAASLAPGAQVTCTATYTATQADVDAGSVTNTATATGTPPSGPPPVSPPSTVTVPVTPAPALTILKTADPTTVADVGDRSPTPSW